MVTKHMKEDDDGKGGDDKSGAKMDKQKVSFYKLFSFADSLDVVLMILGTIGAVANGLSQPLMTLIFGNLINSFGTSDPSHVVKQVSKVHLFTLCLICRFLSFYFTLCFFASAF